MIGTDERGRHTARSRPERGAASAFVVGVAVLLLAFAGLVVDGGTVLNARSRLADDLEQAARSGAGRVDEDAARAGQLRVDPVEGQAAATQFAAARGYTGIVATVPDADTVTITARDRVPSTLLNLVGIGSFDIEATATADAVSQ